MNCALPEYLTEMDAHPTRAAGEGAPEGTPAPTSRLALSGRISTWSLKRSTWRLVRRRT
ncbi:MAG: hypothetical protein P8R54_31955 [Myxococcota bacterium]|nr:hypothetical protein [Myxococcota bacterium]